MSAPRAALLIAAVVATSAGCRRQPAPSTPPTPRAAVEQSVSAGGASARLSLDRDRLTTAERLRLTLDITAPAGAAPSAPILPADLGGFTVAEQQTGAPRLTEGGVAVSTTWVLEPFLPGEYQIPSIDLSAAGGGAPEMSTRPVRISVTSVLPDGGADAAEIGPARDVVDPAPPPRRSAAWAMGGAIGLAAAALAVARWAIRRRARPSSDPCGAAQRRLSQIQAGPLDTPAAARAAVEEASSLLRACLAHRLDPAAPARTTDELLAAPALARNLSDGDLATLRAALRHSDAVKFAGAPVAEAAAREAAAGAAGLVRTLSTVVALGPPVPAVEGGRGD